MKKAISFLFIFSTLICTIFAVKYEDYIMKNVHDEVFEAALILEKDMILFFTQSYCGECIQFKENTLSDKKMAEFLKNRFLVSEIELRSDIKGTFPLFGKTLQKRYQYSYKDLFTKYEIKRTPTSLVFESSRKVAGYITRYKSVEEYIEELKSIKYSFNNEKPKLFRKISYSDRELLLTVVPYVYEYDLEEFITRIDELDKNDYYIIKNSTEKEIAEYLYEELNLKNFNILFL